MNQKPSNIVVEDQLVTTERNRETNRIFGPSEEKQPQIESASWRLQLSALSIGGQEREKEGTLTMFVKFEGSNILEGIKQCVKCGLMQPPLPEYLENLHSAGQNRFDISLNTIYT